MILVFLSLFVSCHGLLLDGITPKTGNGISDGHFNMLMNLLIEERQSRGNLEKVVIQLQQEFKRCNCGNNVDIIGFKNKTEYLEKELHTLQTNYKTLQVKYSTLEQKQINAENNTRRIEKKQQSTEAKTLVLEQEIGQLKGLKSVSDLQTVFQLQNFTKHLEQELQTTNGKLANVESNVKARSQDFLALFNKVKKTDNKTEELESKIEGVKHNLTYDTNVNLMKLKSDVETVQSGLNYTTATVNKITNRAVLSVHASYGTVQTYSVIPFKHVHTSSGINNLTSVRNDGKFTCEKDGLYLISAVISTNENSNGLLYIYKNSGSIATGYRHPQSYLITTTLVVIERLHVGNTIYVKNEQEMYVYGGESSSLTIMQLN